VKSEKQEPCTMIVTLPRRLARACSNQARTKRMATCILLWRMIDTDKERSCLI
jgi:hypothetical protein